MSIDSSMPQGGTPDLGAAVTLRALRNLRETLP